MKINIYYPIFFVGILIFVGIIQASGNTITNTYYGSMWNKTSVGITVDLTDPEGYKNISGLVPGELNGFVFTDNQALIVGVAGTYKIDWTCSFDGGNNNRYGIGVSKNYNIESSRECYAQRTTGSNAIGNVGGTCILSLEIGDTLNFVIDDEADPISDPSIHQISMNVMRMGP